jgi:NAD(P)-dependent dehydrogenase (short-subunit alcohol dehydrogenase family)
MKVEGAVALVTGANRGLGAAIAQALLDSGATVYGAARDQRASRTTASSRFGST